LYYYIHITRFTTVLLPYDPTSYNDTRRSDIEQRARCLHLKVLDGEPAREVLEFLHGKRAIVRLAARLAGEEASAPALALVAADREVDLTLCEVGDAEIDFVVHAIALDVIDIVHEDVLAVAAYEADLAAVVLHYLEFGGIVELLISELQAIRRRDLHVLAVDAADGDVARDICIRDVGHC